MLSDAELDKLISYTGSLRERWIPYAPTNHGSMIRLLSELRSLRALDAAARAWLECVDDHPGYHAETHESHIARSAYRRLVEAVK